MIADGRDVPKTPAAEASSSAMDLEWEKLASAERQAAADREAAARQAADDREERARRDAADREERREERREAAAAAERQAAAAARQATDDREAAARREADDREERREAAATAACQAAADADERRTAAAEQLAAQQEANSIARENGERFADRKGRRAAQLKRFGDAHRASLTRMSDQPIDLINFLDSADRLFADLEVPIDLRVTLIKPYLNERALSLVKRLSGDLVIDYAYVKT